MARRRGRPRKDDKMKKVIIRIVIGLVIAIVAIYGALILFPDLK